MQVKSKLSVKTVFGSPNIKSLFDEIKEVNGKLEYSGPKEISLMRVFGIATGTESGVSTFGDWQSLKGQFKAVNSDTGEVTHSGTCFLPSIAHDLVAGALTGESSVNGVEFAIDIGAVGDATSATKYVYTVKPLIELAENNPLSMLEKRVIAALPAPAPDLTPAFDPAPASEKSKGRK